MVVISRQELYELAWRERLRDLVEPLGLSEPSLRKRCTAKEIPLPGPTYWSGLKKGLKPRVLPLPPRAPGMDEFISTAPNPYSPIRLPVTDEELLGPLPPAPIFDEPLENIRARYVSLVGSPKVPRDLRSGHQKIRSLVAEDERRREAQNARGYAWAYDGPRFDSAFEQRRLRILNCLMLETAKVGGAVRIADHSALSIMVKIHDTTLHILLDFPEAIERGSDQYFSRRAPADAALRLVLNRSYRGPVPDAEWADDESGKLETKIGPIVCEFFVQAESAYRSFRQWEHAGRDERKAARLKAMEEVRIRAEKDAREDEERLRNARINHLVSIADDHERAMRIRKLVEGASACREATPDFLAWREWALCVATEIDPLASPCLLKF